MKPFKDRVASYSDAERQEWHDRENARKLRRYQQIPHAYKPYTDEELNGVAWREAGSHESKLSDEERAKRRHAVEMSLRQEVHEITTADTDATILDLGFDVARLDDTARIKYRQALRALAIPVTEGSPVGWGHRDAIAPFVGAVGRANSGFVVQREVSRLAAEAEIEEDVAFQLASAYNSRLLALQSPSYLVSQLIKNSKDIITDSIEMNGQLEELPVNLEYVQRYLRMAHIVGAKQNLSSATLDQDITAVSFFDLEKTVTTTGLEARRQSTGKRLGGIATALSEATRHEARQTQPLLTVLEDVHAKPERLVEAAKAVVGYEDIFNGDTGNWEGFTLAEHTETVLRNFDENYTDNLPVELLTPMRLAILSHDVGKPLASARGEKYRQKEYNLVQADDFLRKLGID